MSDAIGQYANSFIIGIVSSIIATLIITYFSKKFKIKILKKEVDCNLEFIGDSLYAACFSRNPYFVVMQLSRTMDYIQKTLPSIEMINNGCEKFYCTILYSIYHGCDTCLNNIVSEEGKPIETYLYEYLGLEQGYNKSPLSYSTIIMLQKYNSGISLYDSCIGTIVNLNSSTKEVKEMLNPGGIIDYNCFDIGNKYAVKNRCFTKNEYEEYINNHLVF